MPSTAKPQPSPPSKPTPHAVLQGDLLFIPLLSMVALAWLLYRVFFDFPIWFDETLGKAFFFGLPVWFYVMVTRREEIAATLSFKWVQPGLLLGLAIGGIYGFVTSILSLWQTNTVLQAAELFSSTGFWFEFMLAIFTGFWESLFFFGFVGTVVFDKYKHRPLIVQLLFIVAVFVLFHIPNTLLVFDQSAVPGQLVVLSLFALGQALVFYRWRNIYTLTLSHAIWGLSLLFYGS